MALQRFALFGNTPVGYGKIANFDVPRPRNNDVYSRGYSYNALDMLAYTAPECGLGGGTFSDGEFLVVNGALLKYYGEGGTVNIPDGVTLILRAEIALRAGAILKSSC